MTSNPRRQGFTLVELMISIALVVVLMLGITKVFSLTSQTAGATNQVSSAMRDARGAQATLYQDLSTAVTDGSPCMLLCSSRIPAFRSKADEQADRDGNPLTVDLDGNNTEGETTVPGEIIAPSTYNYRNHRIDTFSFFSRQRLQRQTGGSQATVNSNGANPDTPLMSQMSSGEGWIWYGHLNQPDNNGNFFYDPPKNSNPITVGSGNSATNPNNYYASQWILGRQAILLRSATGGAINDRTGTAQAFMDTKLATPSPAALWLAPLSRLSQSNVGSYSMEYSRFDLANTSIDDYLSRLTSWSNASGVAPMRNAGTGVDKNWWGELFCAMPDSTTGNSGRFQGNKYLMSHPQSGPSTLNGFSFAQQAPIFLPGCTQFIVEYAGDYLLQNNDPSNPATYGQITGLYTNNGGVGDGQVDFIVTKDKNNNVARKIRWYGLPRDTDGVDSSNTYNTGAPDGHIPVYANINQVNLMADVVPLRDVWTATRMGVAPFTTHAPFEKFQWGPAWTGSTVTPKASGSTLPSPTGNDYANMGPNDYYICAWGPNDPKPKMIRIIFTIDDPTGKLPEGQTFEYVFTLP
jgi:prepilin-type N-terminal cleavage/methylation domain-containing protein